MAAEVTERKKGRWLRVSNDLNDFYARRVFDVAYATNETDAIAAVGAQFGVSIGAFHDETNSMRCFDIYAVCPNFTVWVVTAEYRVFTGSTSAPTDPLRQPYKIQWRPGLTNDPSEMDVYGNPILNAAGDAFDPPPNLDTTTWTLVVQRNQPYYNAAQYAPYIGNSNADTFGIRGRRTTITIQKGQARCLGILPIGQYTLNDPYVPVEFAFEFRPKLSATSVTPIPADSWNIRLLNRGFRGWYKDNSNNIVRGRFTVNGQYVTEPVLLNRDGTPVDSNVKVENNQTAVANPNPIDARPNGIGPQFEFRAVGNQSLWFIHYRRTRLINFGGLL